MNHPQVLAMNKVSFVTIGWPLILVLCDVNFTLLLDSVAERVAGYALYTSIYNVQNWVCHRLQIVKMRDIS